MGDVAGNEITHVAAAVILGGLVSAALLTQLVLVPALCVSLDSGRPTPAIARGAGRSIDPSHLCRRRPPSAS